MTCNGYVAAAAGLLVAVPAMAGLELRINEIRIDQPGADNDEYFEIAGPPGTSLAGLTYVVIGDAAGAVPPLQNGAIETVVDLSSAVIPADGVLLVAKPTFSLGAADLVAAFNLEELDNVTHLLVSGFTGALGDDLDVNNDGVLDVLPWSEVLDSVALVINPAPNGVSADFFYSDTVVGPDGAFSPSHAWRCADNLAWSIGTFSIGGLDTPGAPNLRCGAGPDVRISEIRTEQPGDDLDEYFELAGAPGASLDGLTYIVLGDPDDGAGNTDSGVIEAVIPLDRQTIAPNGLFLVAEDDNTFGAVANLFNTLNFEGSDNVTHMLVQGFTGALGDDLDVNDDGALDVTPWSAIVDAVALLETTQPPVGGGEWVYAEATVGPEGPFVPGHVYRCEPSGEWLIGPFDPAMGVDTPAQPNGSCIDCGIPGSGSCFEVHEGPACSESACCEVVCGLDPTCCEDGWDASCVDQAKSICLSGGDPPAVLLSEIRIDQTGNDDDEYFEIAGAPGTSLDGVTYVVLGDGTGGSGVIEAVVDLSGQVIPGSGFFVAAESTFTLGAANLVTSLNFENSDNVSHFLVFNFSGLNGQDLDLDDDGELDETPWTHLIDSVALVGVGVPPDAEHPYGGVTVGPDGPFVPGHVYRCTPAGTWTIGAFNPAGGQDSPGAPNPACDGGSCPEDLDGNGMVDGGDLGLLLGDWGGPGAADFDGSGSVDGADLGQLLAVWGPCV